MRLVGRMVSISSSNSIHVQILGEISKHGTRVASLHQEEEVLVHLVIMHILNRRNQILLFNDSLSNENFTRTSMRSEIEHNVILGSRMKSTRVLLLRQLLQLLDISSHDSKHHLSIHIRSVVIDVLNTALRIILTGRGRTVISEQLTRERIILQLRHSVVAHEDDVVGIHSSSNQILVHTATLRLNTIIIPVGSGGNNDGMSISQGNRENKNQIHPIHLRRQLCNDIVTHHIWFHLSYVRL